MEEDRTFFWYWFVNIPGVGPGTRRKLLGRFGHPQAVYMAGEKELADILKKKQCVYLQESRNTHSIARSMQRLQASGTRFLHWESPDYPEKLRQLFDPPYGIYLRGSLPSPDRPSLAMVGARSATPYGIRVAEQFAGELSRRGIQIISGLAAGIDAAGHRGALQAGGYTLGILGGGIDTMYPRANYFLYRQMYERGGVLSEYNLGIPNSPGLFPIRNRLISAMADGVFVLEAGEKSGSFITIDQALEQGKDVFALPGRISDPLSEGCNRLIAEGAVLVQRPEDIAAPLLEKYENFPAGQRQPRELPLSSAAISGEAFPAPPRKGKPQKGNTPPPGAAKPGSSRKAQPPGRAPQDPEQRKIYELLDEKFPKSFNEILEQSGYNIVKLQYILLEMELSGLIYQSAQNTYLRKF